MPSDANHPNDPNDGPIVSNRDHNNSRMTTPMPTGADMSALQQTVISDMRKKVLVSALRLSLTPEPKSPSALMINCRLVCHQFIKIWVNKTNLINRKS